MYLSPSFGGAGDGLGLVAGGLAFFDGLVVDVGVHAAEGGGEEAGEEEEGPHESVYGAGAEGVERRVVQAGLGVSVLVRPQTAMAIERALGYRAVMGKTTRRMGSIAALFIGCLLGCGGASTEATTTTTTNAAEVPPEPKYTSTAVMRYVRWRD